MRSGWAVVAIAMAAPFLLTIVRVPSAAGRTDVRTPPSPPGRILVAPGAVLPTPAGPRRVTSLLRVPGRMRHGDFVWRDAPGRGAVWIRVDLDRQTVSAFRGGDEIGTAVVLYGTDGKPTPRGSFTVLERDRVHRSSTYGAPMPYTLRLTADGVAIHASDVRYAAATHGCIGVPEGFARRLFDAARKGTPVYVV